jgi:hypothetical protein
MARISIFSFALAILFFACKNEQKTKEIIFEGAYSYMADANQFISCDGKTRMPVHNEAEYLTLERKYLSTVKEGGQKVFVKLKGHIADVPKMEGEGTEQAIVVTEIMAVGGESDCAALKAEAAAPALYSPYCENAEVAQKVTDFLKNNYLKEELKLGLDSFDRQFQCYPIDLNGDKLEEVFVRFQSKHFCGTGGCTFLILDNACTKLLQEFSVSDAPFFVEQEKKNGWNVLLVQSDGAFRMLEANKKGKYPENPSVIKPIPNFAPSGHAQVLFDDKNDTPCRTFRF